MNAMAYDPDRRCFIDPFGGRRDLRKRYLRTVGGAAQRLSEDTLRLIRAARFLSELDMRPDPKLTAAARVEAPGVSGLSAERIRDEFSKLLLGKIPSRGLLWLAHTGALGRFLPELPRLKGVRQGGWHRHDVFVHTLRCIDVAPADLTVRMALLLHDIAKPETRTRDGTGYHFYGHEKSGSRTAGSVLKKLRYPNALIDDVRALIEHHLFEAEVLAHNDAAIRRLMRKVGEGRIERLIQIRKADIRGTSPGKRPSKALVILEQRIQRMRAEQPPLEIKDLAVDGNDVMKWLHLPPGREVGKILSILLAEVLDDPDRNRRSELKLRMKKALQTVGD
jgi:poly(A) polymerase/tRNA nucleotidyltransferase (CCA-adding enzyme)